MWNKSLNFERTVKREWQERNYKVLSSRIVNVKLTAQFKFLSYFQKTHNCDRNELCKNTEGSFSCTCKPGYKGDGKKCKGKYLSRTRNYRILYFY